MRDPLGRGPKMPIDVEWQDERGGQRARYNGPPVTRLLVERAEPTSPCLRFIDPYGNTTFNQHQLPVLIAELETLSAVTTDGQAAVIRALLLFLATARDQVHTYIKFIGD